MINRIKFVFMVLVAIAVLSGCGNNKPTKQEATIAVHKIMAERKKAIETKDINLYKSLILPNYNDGGTTYSDQIKFMESVFHRYKKIEFTHKSSEVDLMFNTARTMQRIYYKPEGVKKPFWDDETTLYRKVKGKWYISGGINANLF